MENDLRGNEYCFELSGVRVTEGKITVNVLRKVRVSARFELAWVRAIGSRLHTCACIHVYV